MITHPQSQTAADQIEHVLDALSEHLGARNVYWTQEVGRPKKVWITHPRDSAPAQRFVLRIDVEEVE